MNLLTTVSRIVSNATANLPIQPSQKVSMAKPNALHVALWIHALSLLVAIPFGWIDVIPGSGSVKTLYNRPLIIKTNKSIADNINR